MKRWMEEKLKCLASQDPQQKQTDCKHLSENGFCGRVYGYHYYVGHCSYECICCDEQIPKQKSKGLRNL